MTGDLGIDIGSWISAHWGLALGFLAYYGISGSQAKIERDLERVSQRLGVLEFKLEQWNDEVQGDFRNVADEIVSHVAQIQADLDRRS